MKNLKVFFALLAILSLNFTACQYYEEDFPQDEYYDDDHYDDDEGDHDGHNHDISEGTGGELTLYRVVGDQIEKIKDYQVSGALSDYQQDYALHLEMWDLFDELIPFENRPYLKELIIFHGEGSLLGYVEPINGDNTQWRMGLAIDIVQRPLNEDMDFIHTLIHEYTHMLTLNNVQVDQNVGENSCDHFYTYEGCTKNDSYINLFYENFWVDIYPEFLAAGDNQNRLDDFYQNHQDQFITDYAATNPGEDIAESFTIFVTKDGQATGNTIADQKVNFMYDFPELVQLRNHMKAGPAALLTPGSWTVKKHEVRDNRLILSR